MSGPIQLTEVDFDQIKENLIDYLKSTRQFTDYDFSGSNLQVILNLIAYQSQLNAYSTNLVANESFLTSSVVRKNVVANARSIGYVPHSARSSRSIVDFQFNLDPIDYPSGFPESILLPSGVAFTTNTGKTSYTFNIVDNEIAAVSNDGVCKFNDINLYEGTSITTTFVVDYSDFDQKFILANANIDATTIRVDVQENPNQENTSFYRRSDNLAELTQESRVYWIDEVDNEYIELEFGDGFFGKKLADNAKIFVTYVVTNGPLANGIHGNSNFVFIGSAFDSLGARVLSIPTITSASTTTGGSDVEEIPSIKFRAPREYAAQNRCVVSEDYDVLIRRIFPPVEDIYIYGGETLAIPEYGRVYIAVKPTTGDALSAITKNYIKKSLDPYRIASIDIKLIDPEVLKVEVDSMVYFDDKKTLKDKATIQAMVIASLERHVESKIVPQFGGAIRYSTIVCAINDADDSITRNNTTLRMRKDMRIIKNTFATYEVCFEQEVKLDRDTPTVYSTGFGLELNGVLDPRVFYFENDPSTIRFKTESKEEQICEIHCFYINEFNEKVKVSFFKNPDNQLIVIDTDKSNKIPTPFGTLNYNRGEIEIAYGFKNGIKFINTEVEGNMIEIRAIPENMDIFAKESVFVKLDVSKSDITAMIELYGGGS